MYRLHCLTQEAQWSSPSHHSSQVRVAHWSPTSHHSLQVNTVVAEGARHRGQQRLYRLHRLTQGAQWSPPSYHSSQVRIAQWSPTSHHSSQVSTVVSEGARHRGQQRLYRLHRLTQGSQWSSPSHHSSQVRVAQWLSD